MFEKKFMELFIVILYWCKISPSLYRYFFYPYTNEKGKVEFKVESVGHAIYYNFTKFLQFAGLDVLLFFAGFFPLTMYIYMHIKTFDKNKWQNIKKAVKKY